MTQRDLTTHITTEMTLAPAVYTEAVEGVGVDLREYDSAVILLSLGAIAGTNPGFQFAVQTSNDDITYQEVSDDVLTQSLAIIEEGEGHFEIGYLGPMRYLRLAITEATGTSPSLAASSVIILGHAHQQP